MAGVFQNNSLPFISDEDVSAFFGPATQEALLSTTDEEYGAIDALERELAEDHFGSAAAERHTTQSLESKIMDVAKEEERKKTAKVVVLQNHVIQEARKPELKPTTMLEQLLLTAETTTTTKPKTSLSLKKKGKGQTNSVGKEEEEQIAQATEVRALSPVLSRGKRKMVKRQASPPQPGPSGINSAPSAAKKTRVVEPEPEADIEVFSQEEDRKVVSGIVKLKSVLAEKLQKERDNVVVFKASKERLRKKLIDVEQQLENAESEYRKTEKRLKLLQSLLN